MNSFRLLEMSTNVGRLTELVPSNKRQNKNTKNC